MPRRAHFFFFSACGACSLVYDVDRLVDGSPPHDAGAELEASVADTGIADGGSSDGRTCPVSDTPNGFCDDFDDDTPLRDRWEFGEFLDVPPQKKERELSITMPLVVDAQATRSFLIKRIDEPFGAASFKASCRVKVVAAPSEPSSVELNTIYVQKLTLRTTLRNTGALTFAASDTQTYFSKERSAPLPMNEWHELTIVLDRSITPRHLTALVDGTPFVEEDIDGPVTPDNNIGFRAGISASSPQHPGTWDVRLDDFRVVGTP